MKRFTEQLQKKADSIKLSSAERTALRERVCSYMEYHPLPASLQTAAKSAKTESAPAMVDSFRTIRIAWKELLQAGAIFACVTVVAVPFFAERAVPGDTLYAVKVGFNEEVRSTLTWDPYQKVEWETARINRRLAEARLLAEEGRLTEEVEAEVAAAVTEHTKNAKNEIAAIGETDAEAAAIASIEFDSAVAVQADVLAAKSATGTIVIAAALAAASPQADAATTTPPAYDKLIARVEINTTRIYELLEQLKNEPELDSEVELENVTRRFEDIERTIVDAIALHESDELAARVMLVDVLKRTQKLTIFMTDIAVRESVSVEDVVPVMLTTEEKAAFIADLNKEINDAVAVVEVRLDQITDDSVLEKLTTSLDTITDLQIAAQEAEFAQVRVLLLEARALAFDAKTTASTLFDIIPDTVPDTASSTIGTGSSTNATSTEPTASSTAEEVTSLNDAATIETVDEIL